MADRVIAKALGLWSLNAKAVVLLKPLSASTRQAIRPVKTTSTDCQAVGLDKDDADDSGSVNLWGASGTVCSVSCELGCWMRGGRCLVVVGGLQTETARSLGPLAWTTRGIEVEPVETNSRWKS